MDRIEELEQRCSELEDRVAALEKALVAVAARPAQKVVTIERIEPAERKTEIWMNGVPLHRGAEYPDSETFKTHTGKVMWYGGQ